MLTRQREQLLGAVAGATAIQALLRLPSFGFHGASALLAALAMAPALVSGYKQCRSRLRRRVRLAVLTGAGAAALSVLVFGIATLLARSAVEAGVDRSQDALEAARRGDRDTADRSLTSSHRSFERAAAILDAWWVLPARAVPVVGQHARVLAEMSTEGSEITTQASGALAQADYQQLRYRSGAFDVERIRSLAAPLRRTAKALADAQANLRRVRSSWLLGPVQDRLVTYGEQVDRAAPEAAQAADIIELAPDILGASGRRQYFIAFVTPSELRGSGGFMGSYGVLTADAGRLRLTRSGPIAELIEAAPPGTRKLTGPPDYLARYGRFRPQDRFQDVTFSPDFPADAQVIEELYPQSGGTRLDGVLQVDPYALAALLEFTGPIPLEGSSEPLTAANATNLLLRDQYVIFGNSAARGEVLDEAVSKTFRALTTGDLPSPREIGRVLGPVVDRGRLKLHSVRAAEQRLFAESNLAWAMPRPNGQDFLSVTSQNVGNNKIDAYQSRRVTYRATINPTTRQLDALLTVAITNRAPSSGLPPYVIGNTRGFPEGTNRTLLEVYTPHQLTEAAVEGATVGVESQMEAGWRVYGTDVSIPPGQTVTVRFRLSGTTRVSGGNYTLNMFPQPTVAPDRASVTVSAGLPPLTSNVVVDQRRQIVVDLDG